MQDYERGQGLVSYACIPCFYVVLVVITLLILVAATIIFDSLLVGILAGVVSFFGMLVGVVIVGRLLVWYYK